MIQQLFGATQYLSAHCAFVEEFLGCGNLRRLLMDIVINYVVIWCFAVTIDLILNVIKLINELIQIKILKSVRAYAII
jgi:hypothetical protein